MSTLSGTGVRKGCGLSFTLYGHFCKRHFVIATFYISGMVISVGAGLNMGGVFLIVTTPTYSFVTTPTFVSL